MAYRELEEDTGLYAYICFADKGTPLYITGKAEADTSEADTGLALTIYYEDDKVIGVLINEAGSSRLVGAEGKIPAEVFKEELIHARG